MSPPEAAGLGENCTGDTRRDIRFGARDTATEYRVRFALSSSFCSRDARFQRGRALFGGSELHGTYYIVAISRLVKQCDMIVTSLLFATIGRCQKGKIAGTVSPDLTATLPNFDENLIRVPEICYDWIDK